MTPALFDSHCHLSWEEAEHPVADTLERARAAGVLDLLCVGVDLASSRRAAEIAAAEPGVRASAGIHPNDLPLAPGALGRELAGLERLLAGGGFAAVGETGLDRHWDRVPAAIQEEGFQAQLELAAAHGLPVVIHCREAIDRVRDVLRSLGRPAAGVMHCWSGRAEEVDDFLDLGLHVSFAGNLSYKRNEELREAARRVPRDRLLLETDAPFLAPQPRRGRRNEPAFLPHTLAALAAARGEDPEALAAATRANAYRLFGPAPAGGGSAAGMVTISPEA
ncbi:MAG: TatD family deoxyribonuclease [Planctomycetota bacterium]|nr:MAG: TatD family deoxyribonuclease [Planctomycetota bacterium]